MSSSAEESILTTGALEGFREKKLEVTLVLQELADVAQELGAQTLQRRIQQDLVHKLEEDRFNLVVVGEFNHGKTTFVNALLGENILPTGVTPTTATIHHLRYGDEPSARVVWNDEKTETIEFNHVRDFIVGSNLNLENVHCLEVEYPASLLKERIVLVDTPGVNDLSLQRADITYSYIPQSDAVLFLLDAGQILKESERTFLQEKIIGQARDKILFVITKWDLLSPSEQEEALAYTKHNLTKLVKNEPVVFPVSAQKALSGTINESGMPELVKHLTQFLAEQRGRILLDNALGEGQAIVSTLTKGADAKRRALVMDDQELARRISAIQSDLAGQGSTLEQRRQKIREDVSAVRAWARRDLDRFVDDAIRILTPQIEAADAEHLKTYFQSYLESFFRVWAEAETQEIGVALEEIATRTIALIREDAHETAHRVGEQLGSQLPGLKVEVDSLLYDAGATGLLLAGVAVLLAGSPFALVMLAAAPALAWFGRGQIQAEYKRSAKERMPIVIREVASKVGPKMDQMINDFAAKLDAWVIAAGEELHRELLEVLQAAQSARAKGIEQSASARAETEVQSAKLVKIRSELEVLRATLWGKSIARDAAQLGISVDSAGSSGGSNSPPPLVNAQGGNA